MTVFADMDDTVEELLRARVRCRAEIGAALKAPAARRGETCV